MALAGIGSGVGGGFRDTWAMPASSISLIAHELQFTGANGPVFSHLSFQLRPGVCSVQGGESRGKSVLLRMLAGELSSKSGSVQMHGADGVLDAHKDAKRYRAQVAWTDPRSTAHDTITVSDYMQTMASAYLGWDAAVMERLKESLDLAAHWHKPVYMLSTGSKRKVWWASALASGAALTLVDEPFAALDFASIRVLLAELNALQAQSQRVVVIADYAAPAGLAPTHVIDLGD
jgi:ABC-type multidrug transport system ATPase subunit